MKLLPFFLLLTISGFGQESNIIHTEPNLLNFQKAMSIEKPTDSQIDSIIALSAAYSENSSDTSLILGLNAMELTKNESSKNRFAKTLFLISVAQEQLGQEEKSKEFIQQAETIAKAIGDDKLLAGIYKNLGAKAIHTGDYKVALDYFIQSANIWESLDDKINQASAYKNISSVFFNMNEPKRSREYMKKVSAIAEELDDDNLRIEVASEMAIDFMNTGIYYFLDNQTDSLNMDRHMDTLNLYFQKSEAKYLEVLALAKKIDSREMVVVILNNLVALLLNMEKYDRALKRALEAEALAKALGVLNLEVQSKFNLASVYRRWGKFDKAVKYGEESLFLAKKHKWERKTFLANRVLMDLYKDMGRYDKAMVNLEEIRAYEKELGDTERNKALAEIEEKYQSVKKEKQILELEATNAKISKQRNMILSGSFLVGLLGFLGYRFNKIQKERNDKKELAAALILGQEEERKRISRDLHDGIGQSLLFLKKQMASTAVSAEENQQLISSTLEEVRSISRDLHPIQLEKIGLTAAIQNVISKLEQSTDLFVSKEIENIDNAFPKKGEIHIFRVIQEALNNIVKHAEATAAKVSIKLSDDQVTIKVMDDGKGFNHDQAVAKHKSLGLRTMLERISSLNGKLKIERNNPAGMMMTFTIPK